MSEQNQEPDDNDKIIKELKYLLGKMGNPPRGAVCSDHIEGQDANRAEVRKLLRKRIEFYKGKND